MHAFDSWRPFVAAAALALAATAAQAQVRLIDGFGLDQGLDGSYIAGADILAGTRDLLALAPPDPAAVRVEGGHLFIDTRTVRAVVRYAAPQAGTLFNLSFGDNGHHGEWLLTYRATRTTTLQFFFRAEPVPGVTFDAVPRVTLDPSAGFVTVNLGTPVAPVFPLHLSRSMALQLEGDGAPGSFEIDALRLAGPVPEPAGAALWLAGLGALAAYGRRAARRRSTGVACLAVACAAPLAGCDGPSAPMAAWAPQPAVCTAQEWNAILDQATASLDAAARGSDTAFLDTMRSWRSAPPACRPLIARLQPVAANCTAAEARTLMQLVPAILGAAARGDLRGMVAGYDHAAATLSPACWRAANQHSHPRVVRACSQVELEGLSAQAPEIQRGLLVAAATLNLPAALGLAERVERLTNALAPACQSAIFGAMQASAPRRPGMPTGGGMPSVLIHGNGTFSVPGVASCPASGCVLM